jgi:hypothetical protein
MKANPLLVERLANAIKAHGGMPVNASERQRWDAMWRAVDAGAFDVGAFYTAGMNDDHIDTALRRIAAGKIWID